MHTGNTINLPAMLSVVLLTIILAGGMKMSSVVINSLVVTKLIVVIMFIFGGIKYADSANLSPFTPFGVDGIFHGALTVFFAYIGFDAVSTTAQEAKNPQRDLPIGILGSLSICTILYVAVCLVLSSLLPFSDIPENAPVASAFLAAGGPSWYGTILALGSLAGLISVLMVMMIGQPRIFRSMAFDGLFPQSFAYIHPKTNTPVVTTMMTGGVTAIASAFLPIDILANLTSIGTLLAFLLVSLAVIILRIREPERERPFKVPGGKIGGFVFPSLSVAIILLLIVKGGSTSTLFRVIAWLSLGLVVYFTYGFWNSKLRHPEKWSRVDGEAGVVGKEAVVDKLQDA